MNTQSQNKAFEIQLRSACENHLKDDIDVDNYISVVLDEMYWGEDKPYATETGTDYYHEIGSRYSNDGNPHVVNL